MKARRFFAFVAGALMLVGVGCTPDDGNDDPAAEASISLNKTTEAVALTGGSVSVDITSNAAWTATASVEDVTIAPASGEKNGSAVITVPSATAPRTIEVTFKATKQQVVAGVEVPSVKTAVLTISQNASGEIIEGGIASITSEGDYEIEDAWVVATATQGFVMTDATGASILMYTGSGASIPAVGTVISVSGAVVTYNGMLQFDRTATVTPSSETVTVNNGTPTEISTYAALDELKNNMVVKYVEMKGKLECKMSNEGYMNYNIYVQDRNGYDDWKGSVYSPVAEIATKLESWNGTYVIARGYSIYVSGTVYVNIVATDVEIDASHPVLNAENIANVPAAGVQNATHNVTVTALDNVTATPDGTIVTAASVAGNVLTYTVAANTGEAREGSITLSAEGVESVTIKVYQLGAVATTATKIDKIANLVAGDYLVAGYLTTYTSNGNTYDWTNYPYHFWTGAVSSTNTTSNSDLLTVNGNESFVLDPNMSAQDAAKGQPATITLVAVDGKANTYYVKSGDKYLYSAVADTNRRMQLGDTPTEWVAADHEKGGIMLSSNGANLGTAGATYNLLRSYKDSSISSLKYGLIFFKKN